MCSALQDGLKLSTGKPPWKSIERRRWVHRYRNPYLRMR